MIITLVNIELSTCMLAVVNAVCSVHVHKSEVSISATTSIFTLSSPFSPQDRHATTTRFERLFNPTFWLKIQLRKRPSVASVLTRGKFSCSHVGLGGTVEGFFLIIFIPYLIKFKAHRSSWANSRFFPPALDKFGDLVTFGCRLDSPGLRRTLWRRSVVNSWRFKLLFFFLRPSCQLFLVDAFSWTLTQNDLFNAFIHGPNFLFSICSQIKRPTD